MIARRLNPPFIPTARSFLSASSSYFAHLCLLTRTVRNVHIRATPSTASLDGFLDLSEQTQSIPKLTGAGPFPAGSPSNEACSYSSVLTEFCVADVKFEVLGAPYSLLSVSLPASSTLYSRRGTLVGVNGKAENVTALAFLSKLIKRGADRYHAGRFHSVVTGANSAGRAADSIPLPKSIPPQEAIQFLQDHPGC